MSSIGRKLVSGSALSVFNMAASAIVSILIMPFVVHALGDRQYGVWALVASFTGYYGVLDLGMSTAVGRYLAKALGVADQEECCRIFNTALRIYLGIGATVLVIAAVLAVAAPYFSKSPEEGLLFRKVILILGASTALMFPSKVFQGALEAHLRFDRIGIFDLLTLALRATLVVFFISAGFKILGLAWATFLAGIPTILLQVHFAFKDLPFLRLRSRYWGISTAKALFSYSTFSFIIQLAGILRFQVDNLVVASMVGLAAVTHYTVANRLAQYFMEITIGIFGGFRTVFSRQEGAQDFEAIRWTLRFATKISVFVSTFIAFGLIAWGKLFIGRWMGKPYLDAYPCLVVLVLGLMFGLWQNPSWSLLFGVSKHKFLAAWTSIEAIANLVLSITLARHYGIVGVALGTMIPLVFSKLLVQPVYVCKIVGIPYTEYIEGVAKNLAMAAGCLVFPMLLTIEVAAPDYKRLFLVGLLSLIAYVVPLWMIAFDRGETNLLRRALLPKLMTKS